MPSVNQTWQPRGHHQVSPSDTLLAHLSPGGHATRALQGRWSSLLVVSILALKERERQVTLCSHGQEGPQMPSTRRGTWKHIHRQHCGQHSRGTAGLCCDDVTSRFSAQRCQRLHSQEVSWGGLLGSQFSSRSCFADTPKLQPSNPGSSHPKPPPNTAGPSPMFPEGATSQELGTPLFVTIGVSWAPTGTASTQGCSWAGVLLWLDDQSLLNCSLMPGKCPLPGEPSLL